jgi:hypothetical protein
MSAQSGSRAGALRRGRAGTLRIVETEGRGDAATFAAHLADGPDDAAGRAEHLRRCLPCARVARSLRAEPSVGPDLELRLLRAFREWRDA